MAWWSRFSLEGRTALITGGSRGIGRATAELFAQAGAEVIVSSRNGAALEEVAAAIRAAGGKAQAIPAHMGRLEDVDALLSELERRALRVDVLVNNAGISPLMKEPFSGTSPELWQKVMDVNLRGPFLLAARLGGVMAERGAGSIINISSAGAMRTTPLIGAYCVSKSALNTLTEVFAKEFGPRGVRVNTLTCGLVETAMGDWTIKNEKAYEFCLGMTPLGRHSQPDEIAYAALFLASQAGSFVTGGNLVVDGGTAI
jgi:NAD(P)-dependent dehydrogenase (short-subunit alcohol dehydrogenase family)